MHIIRMTKKNSIERKNNIKTWGGGVSGTVTDTYILIQEEYNIYVCSDPGIAHIEVILIICSWSSVVLMFFSTPCDTSIQRNVRWQ